MPTTIKAYTVINSDNTYTIALNSRLNREQHLLLYHHKLQHIENGDYKRNCDVNIIEIDAYSI